MGLPDNVPVLPIAAVVIQVIAFASMIALGFLKERTQHLGIWTDRRIRRLLNALVVLVGAYVAWRTLTGPRKPVALEPNEGWLTLVAAGVTFVAGMALFRWIAKRRGWRFNQ